MSADSTRKGILLMILAVFLFTIMDAVAKGLIARYPAPQVVWARFAGQAVIVAVVLGPRMGPMLRTAHPWLHVWRSAFQLCATGFFFLALAYIGLPEATALAASRQARSLSGWLLSGVTLLVLALAWRLGLPLVFGSKPSCPRALPAEVRPKCCPEPTKPSLPTHR